MRFLASTIPMRPTSVTSTSSMDRCDQSTHTHHRPEPRRHDYVALNDLRRGDRVQGTRPDEVSRRAPLDNGVMTSLVHGRLAQHSAWMAWSSHRSLTSTSITCRQLTLRRLRRDYQNLMTVQSQAWLTYRSSSSQGSERSEGSVTAKTSWRLTPMRNARRSS